MHGPAFKWYDRKSTKKVRKRYEQSTNHCFTTQSTKKVRRKYEESTNHCFVVSCMGKRTNKCLHLSFGYSKNRSSGVPFVKVAKFSQCCVCPLGDERRSRCPGRGFVCQEDRPIVGFAGVDSDLFLPFSQGLFDVDGFFWLHVISGRVGDGCMRVLFILPLRVEYVEYLVVINYRLHNVFSTVPTPLDVEVVTLHNQHGDNPERTPLVKLRNESANEHVAHLRWPVHRKRALKFGRRLYQFFKHGRCFGLVPFLRFHGRHYFDEVQEREVVVVMYIHQSEKVLSTMPS